MPPAKHSAPSETTTRCCTVTMDHVSKSFGNVTVIEDVSLTITPGTVLALLGENGAGKSTLINMLAGVHEPDSGTITVDGTPTHIASVSDAQKLGIATIHQELQIVSSLSVAENIMLGRLPQRFGVVDRSAMRRHAVAALNRIGLDIDPDTPVGSLGIAHQQMVEIAKALCLDARVLILDEPTAALTAKEAEQLFTVMEELAAKGVGMVFISHHLDEITRIADHVAVLRDGRLVAEVPPDTSHNTLVAHMVGRDIDNHYPRVRGEVGDALLTLTNASGHGFHNISLQVHAGEVVGLAGLVGAGRTELLRSIAAQFPDTGLVPEDRKNQGLILDASVAENIGLATFRQTSRYGLVNRSHQRARARDISDSLHIRMSSIDQRVRYLSGGNQQKVVFARWVLAGTDIMLLDEPTRGVDVGAKVEIYTIINEITAGGGAVLMASSDLPEILGMSDRILVMSAGRIAGELTPDATQDDIMALAVSQRKEVVA